MLLLEKITANLFWGGYFFMVDRKVRFPGGIAAKEKK